METRTLVTAALAGALLLGACGGGSSSGGSIPPHPPLPTTITSAPDTTTSDPGPTTPGTTEPHTPSTIGAGSGDSLTPARTTGIAGTVSSRGNQAWGPQADILTATQQSLEMYWGKTLTNFTGPIWRYYTEDALPPQPRTACGVDSARPDAVFYDNSFYCGADQILTADISYAEKMTQRFGNAAEVWLIAHEFGHRVADTLGWNNQHGITPAPELTADCLAGVFVRAISAGGYPLTLDPGDVQKMMQTVKNNADPGTTTEWLSPQHHGVPIDRATAFATGVITQDMTFCKPYIEMTEGIVPVTLSNNYVFRNPPSTTTTPDEQRHYLWRVRSTTYPNLRLDITGMHSDTKETAAQILDNVDWYYTLYDSTATHAAAAVTIDGGVNGMDAATRDYTQSFKDGTTETGYLLAVTRDDGTGVILDVYSPTPPANVADWTALGNYIVSSAFGITNPS